MLSDFLLDLLGSPCDRLIEVSMVDLLLERVAQSEVLGFELIAELVASENPCLRDDRNIFFH